MINKIRNFVYFTACGAGVLAVMLGATGGLSLLYGFSFPTPLAVLMAVAAAVLVAGAIFGLTFEWVADMWQARHPVKSSVLDDLSSDTELESFVLGNVEYTFRLPVGSTLN